MRGAIEVAGRTCTLVSAFLSKARAHQSQIHLGCGWGVGACRLGAYAAIAQHAATAQQAPCVNVGLSARPLLPCRRPPFRLCGGTRGVMDSSTLHLRSRCVLFFLWGEGDGVG